MYWKYYNKHIRNYKKLFINSFYFNVVKIGFQSNINHSLMALVISLFPIGPDKLSILKPTDFKVLFTIPLAQ